MPYVTLVILFIIVHCIGLHAYSVIIAGPADIDDILNQAIIAFNLSQRTVRSDYPDITFPLTPIPLNTNCNARDALALAVTALQKCRPNCIGMLGGWCSSATKTLSFASQQFEIPIVSYGAESEEFADRKEYPLFLRTVSSSLEVATIQAWLVKGLGYKSAGLLNTNDNFGSDFADALGTQAVTLGIEITISTSINALITNPLEIRSQIESLRSSRQNVFILSVPSSDVCSLVVRAARSGGIMGTGYLWVVSDICASVTQQDLQTLAGSLWVSRDVFDQPVGRDFILRYTAYTGRPLPSVWPAFQYDGWMSYWLAVRQMIALGQDPTDGNDLLNALQSLNFAGATGRVGFSTTTGGRLGLNYNVMNIQKDGHSEGVGNASLNHDGAVDLAFALNRIYWPGGAPSRPIHKARRAEQALAWWVVLIIVVFVLVFAVAFSTLFVRFHRRNSTKLKVTLEFPGAIGGDPLLGEHSRGTNSSNNPLEDAFTNVMDAQRAIGAPRINPSNPSTPEVMTQHLSTHDASLPPVPMSKPLGLTTQFRVGRQLGSGATSRVFVGIMPDGRHIAVKEFYMRSHEDQDVAAARMVHEVRLLLTLTHENIVSIYNAARADGKLYIFMELCSGGSLLGFLRSYGPLERSLAVTYMRQILKGLAYLHEHRVVHRDVKSANVLLKEDGTVVLADFGAAFVRPPDIESTIEQTGVGTLLWMPPEVLMRGAVQPAGDIWSVGCVLMEMLTAQLPWSHLEGGEITKVMVCISGMVELPPAITDPEALDFLSKCFSQDPESRPSAHKLLAHPYLALPPPASPSQMLTDK